MHVPSSFTRNYLSAEGSRQATADYEVVGRFSVIPEAPVFKLRTFKHEAVTAEMVRDRISESEEQKRTQKELEESTPFRFSIRRGCPVFFDPGLLHGGRSRLNDGSHPTLIGFLNPHEAEWLLAWGDRA